MLLVDGVSCFCYLKPEQCLVKLGPFGNQYGELRLDVPQIIGGIFTYNVNFPKDLKNGDREGGGMAGSNQSVDRNRRDIWQWQRSTSGCLSSRSFRL